MKWIRILAVSVLLSFCLSACSKSDTTTNNDGTKGSTQLNWDQGNWNQTNWQ